MGDSTAPVYFVSDAHLGLAIPGCDAREAALVEFLRDIASKGSALYIVGDLFDFWIEYRRAIRPDYFTILHELAAVREKGVSIHYLAGNHDFALGPFLRDALGIHTHLNDYHPEIQGKNCTSITATG